MPAPSPVDASAKRSDARDVGAAVVPEVKTGKRPVLARGAAVLALATLIVGGVMLAFQAWVPREEPWNSAELAQARTDLQADPKNEALKNRVRDLDRDLRAAYFRRLERNRQGAVLLLVGGALALFWTRRSRMGDRTPQPLARAAADSAGVEVARTRRAIAGVGVTMMAAGVVVGAMGWGRGVRPVQDLTMAAQGAGVSVPVPSKPTAGEEEGDPGKQWGRFRGHEARGTVDGPEVPLRWDMASGDGVRWKTPVPLEGYNSPVVWGSRIFLTGGNKRERLVYAFDAAQGAILWQRPVTSPDAPVPAVEPPDQSGMAASTVATDGKRVFAMFASGDVGALDVQGRWLWHKRLDVSGNGYGHASSLVAAGDLVLVQADQGQPEDGKSEVLALQADNGTVRWRAARPVGGSWATPLVIAAKEGSVAVLSGDPWLMAYDLATGKERWRASVLGGELAPSPVVAGDLVIATSPGHALLGVRWEGSGESTPSRVVWKLESEIPDVPTPLVVGELLLTADTEGHVHCREAATGVKVWSKSLEMEIQASPVASGGRVYLFSQSGTVVVLKIGRAFEELARFEMGDEVYATPAMADGVLYVRTKKSLVSLGGRGTGKEVAHAGR